MTDLQAIVYVSTAHHPLTLSEAHHLLARARERNVREGVTGVLLYSDGNFMQYIEGSASGLATVYQAIVADPLHYGIIELLREPREQREFSEWAMAFRSADPMGAEQTNHQNALLSAFLEQATANPSPARILLAGFWRKARRLDPP